MSLSEKVFEHRRWYYPEILERLGTEATEFDALMCNAEAPTAGLQQVLGDRGMHIAWTTVDRWHKKRVRGDDA